MFGFVVGVHVGLDIKAQTGTATVNVLAVRIVCVRIVIHGLVRKRWNWRQKKCRMKATAIHQVTIQIGVRCLMAVGEQVRSRRGISDSNTNDRNPEEYYAALSLPWEPFCISRWKDSAFVYNLVALSGHGGDLVR